MSHPHLARNLRLLCANARSISDVCRELEINRQQFNKYLSGAHKPSAYNLTKICRHFGVEEFEVLLPSDQFASRLELRTRRADRRVGGGFEQLFDRAFPRDTRALRRYEGFYHSHFYSLGWRGQIMRSLICLYEHDGRMSVKSIERYKDPQRQDRYVMKYNGLVTMTSNRLFTVEYEYLLGGAVAMTILNTSYRSHLTLLTGLTTGASTGRRRAPAAARVVYEYLGKSVDRYQALKACGMFPESSSAIDPEIKRLISNDIEPDDKVLVALGI